MKTIILIFWNFFAGKGVKRNEELYKKRIAICKSNSCGMYRKQLGVIDRCADCGCFLAAKARIDEWYIKCPKALW